MGWWWRVFWFTMLIALIVVGTLCGITLIKIALNNVTTNSSNTPTNLLDIWCNQQYTRFSVEGINTTTRKQVTINDVDILIYDPYGNQVSKGVDTGENYVDAPTIRVWEYLVRICPNNEWKDRFDCKEYRIYPLDTEYVFMIEV